MKKNTLTKAIALTLGSAALTLGAVSSASAHTMYNGYNAYASNIGTDNAGGGTDGWNNTFTATPVWYDSAAATTPTSTVPFGYTGNVANWMGMLHHAGASLEISSQDAFNNYGIWADIDTAKGAWNDAGPNGSTTSGKGWAHNTDLGMLKSMVHQRVTLTASSLNTANVDNFGISVYKGMSTTNYSHHGGWNFNYEKGVDETPAEGDNPLGLTVEYIDHGDRSTVTFDALPGQVYTVLLGGFSGAGNFGPHAGYVLDVTTSPVPVPAAAWLFGGALASLIGANRRKRVIPV